MKTRLEMIKEAQERHNMKKTTARIDKRKKSINTMAKFNKAIAKASHQAPNSLECFHDKNRHSNTRQTRDYLAGSSYMETYLATKNDWDY
jgi:hypothetical protein